MPPIRFAIRRVLVRVLVWTAGTAIIAVPARAQEAHDSLSVSFSAFVDAYYAYDTNRPPTLDRAFTTQAARHNEFNINLAHLAASVAGPRVRARLALQAGTSVQANYAGEPRIGTVSGNALSRAIQEAVVGVRLAPTAWLDGGIFFSHMGSESYISIENPTYTRSLVAENSPYYQAGARLTWDVTPSVTTQLNLVNGWQNISETNGDKAVGARVDWRASPRLTVSAYNFIGNEAPDTAPTQLRVFHGVAAKVSPSERLTLQGTVDIGTQDAGNAWSTWYGGALIAHLQASSTTALVARVERYADPDQVIVATGTSTPFKVSGGSIGVDVTPARNVAWRTELRTLTGPGRLFPSRTGLATGSTTLASSLAVRF